MRYLSITPSITVTIGRHTRIYYAFVTTAPADLDSPATVTLHASTFADVVGFAAEVSAQERTRDLVLEAYAEYEERAAIASDS
jgi:hypothetical protein